MRSIYVYADFDWLEKTELIGELSYDSVRGSDTYAFSFSKSWLRSFGSVFLSADLQNFVGMQYTQPGKEIFSCFSDALPDRWGQTLLKRREQIASEEEKRPVRRLSSFDFLVGIDDASRMGGFRFAEKEGAQFINADDYLRVPPLANVRDLMIASREIEQSEMNHILPQKKWLLQLMHPGTSLGGARPKAR